MARVALHGPRITNPRPLEGMRRFPWLTSINTSWVGAILLFATGAVSLYLIQVSAVATGGYELQRVESERDGWRARNEQLELELAKRRSLVWAEAEAVTRLGMVRSEPPVYLMVPSSPSVAARSSRGGPRPEDNPTRTNGAGVDGAFYRPQPGNPTLLVESVRDWLQQLLGQ